MWVLLGVYMQHPEMSRERFWMEVRSISVGYIALVEVCSMGILRFELTSGWCLYGVFSGMYYGGLVSCLDIAQ